MPPAVLKPTIPASMQPQTHALDHMAIRISPYPITKSTY